MDPKSSFAIKLLEKIGAPLIKAVEKPTASSEDNAEIIARLLGQAVKMSIALNGTLGVEENEAQADSTRMALAAIVSPLLAAHYEEHKKEPEEQDIQRMIKSLEVVMSFADKFKPAEEGQSRLSTIDHTMPFFDETQGVLNTMLAMTPVIPAIYEFSFGQPENKLMQDVAAKLESKAAELAGDNKIGQILILQALATIYADCHRYATAQMASSNDEARQSPAMEPIWQDFDKRALMLGAIAGQDNSGTTSTSIAPIPVADASTEVPAAPVEQPVQEQPIEGGNAEQAQKPAIFGNAPATSESAPVAPTPEATPEALAPQAAPAAAGGGGPMSFFTKGDAATPPATPAPAEATPVAPAPPPEEPAQEQQVQEQALPAVAPANPLPPTTPEPPKDNTADNFAESGKPDESGNPMSFFGKKKDGE